MPPFLQHVPLLGSVLRGICVRAVQRMLEDLQGVLDRLAAGEALEAVLKPKPPAYAPAHAAYACEWYVRAVQRMLQDLQGVLDRLSAGEALKAVLSPKPPAHVLPLVTIIRHQCHSTHPAVVCRRTCRTPRVAWE